MHKSVPKPKNDQHETKYKITVEGVKEYVECCEEMKKATRELKEEIEQLNTSMERTTELLNELRIR